MLWKGYNFEDVIVFFECVVCEDIFIFIYIEYFEMDVWDIKFGEEELINDILNVSEEVIKDFDENGIIWVGVWVCESDILIGKIIFKGEFDLILEEKFFCVIFGDKVGDVKDVFMKVFFFIKGVIIDK